MLRFLYEKDLIHSFVIWALVLVWFTFVSLKFLEKTRLSLEHFITSQSFYLFSETPEEAREVVIVAIDESSRKSLNQKWPWKRTTTAELIENISSHSPKVIGLDIVFSGKSGEEEDERLASALKSHPGIVLGYVTGGDGEGEKPLLEFAKKASMGFVNKPLKGAVLDSTRIYGLNGEGETELSIDIEILKRYLGLKDGDVKVTGKRVFLGEKISVPSDRGITPLNYLVYPTSFTTIPARFVLEKKVDGAHFKDKIVIVGATDPLVHDEYLTPLGVFPGVTIIGNSIVMHLSNRFVQGVPLEQKFLFVFITGILILVITSTFRFSISSILTSAVLAIVYFSFIYLRGARDVVLPYLPILFSGLSAYVIPNLYSYINLSYMTARLKTLATTDPLSGFHSPRFFVLEAGERLKRRGSFNFVALRIRNHRKMTLELSFDEIKSLTGLVSAHLKKKVEGRFTTAVFSRISNDTFGIILDGGKEEAQEFFRAFVEEVKGREWEVGSRRLKVLFHGCLVFRSSGNYGTGDDFLYQAERILREMKDREWITEEVKEKRKEERKAYNISDFIAYDWEERGKDLERGLKEVLETNRRLDRLNIGTLTALARTVDAKSPWTLGHSERVTELALKIGRAFGLTEGELENLERAGLLHDIGKIGITHDIIDKQGRLTAEERQAMQEHPGKGAKILEPIEEYAEIIPVVYGHHEWFDGNGYPRGLKGEEISLGARILAAADVFDALITDRPYRPGLSLEKVREMIKEGEGKQFDPLVVGALLKVTAEKGIFHRKVNLAVP